MTKTIIIGEPEESKKTAKKIEFIKALQVEGDFVDIGFTDPSGYDYIELISLGYSKDFDLIFAYRISGRKHGILYLGHWNDGVV